MIKINSDNQINQVADYMLELDKILQYSIKDGTDRTYLSVEITYNKTKELYVPQNDEEREKWTKDYYISELEEIL